MATIQENITRIMDGKNSIRNSIINKGLEVPEGLRVDTYADYILHIGEEFSMDVPDVSSTSVWDEINRIKNAEDSIKSAIREKGVDVPDGLRIDDLSVYVDEIEVGPQPLTFTMLDESGYIKFYKAKGNPGVVNIEINLNNSDWEPYTLDTQISMNQGDKVQFRGDRAWTSSSSNYYGFAGSGLMSASGSIMSLINDEPMNSYQFHCLFNNYKDLYTAPELPATVMQLYCYNAMFYGCTNLVNAPELPATKLQNYCYNAMFYGCTNLVNAPELPATELKDYCYQNMFKGCTSLVDGPKIYATIGANNCCYQMFQNCTKLETVYSNMEKLKYTTALNSWLSGVTTSGTLYKNPISSITDWQLPSTWTIEDWIQ